jgi:hypothetical protein
VRRAGWIGLIALAAVGSASADAPAAPRPRSVGFYAEAGLGAKAFLGEASEHSAIGPSASLHLGYDIFSWLSLGGRIEMSTHEATVPPPPEGEIYQLYGAAAEARLGIPVGPLALFADGALGMTLISTNVLERVMVLDPGEELTPYLSAGGGLEYQLQNRHYALGLAAAWTVMPAFDNSQSIAARASLRYTY